MTEEKMQELAKRIVGEIQSEIDKLIEERDAARARAGRMRTALDEAEATISQMRTELREPLELRGSMEGAIRAAIFRADDYLRNSARKPSQDDGKPEVKSIGGANTLDELIGLMEIARDNKIGITLDWVEVGIIMRAAEVKSRLEEAR